MIIPQAAVLLVAAALITGCAAGTGTSTSLSPSDVVQSPDAPVSSPPVTIVATRTATGGLCMTGTSCETVFTVASDGSWVIATGDHVQSGQLMPVQLDAIVDGAATTTLPDAPPFTGTCPIAYDGQEVIYSWSDESMQTVTVSACEKEVSEADPLVAAVEAAFASASESAVLVEPDGMEAQAARTQAIANTMLGRPEAEAIALIEGVSSMKLTTRIVRRDAETFAVTEDYSPTRVNLSIHAGIVTDATVG